ncbi:MAG: MoaD/ThiS family protein [Candidatus Aenigmarchaeota archaeon]|nr:MoaD/ThiS family protein [Candidatus Aenigmarchaeota archaeon]
MKIRVKLHKGPKTVDIGPKFRVIDVLTKLGINSETVLVKKSNDIVLEEEILKENDEIEVIRIISGG